MRNAERVYGMKATNYFLLFEKYLCFVEESHFFVSPNWRQLSCGKLLRPFHHGYPKAKADWHVP